MRHAAATSSGSTPAVVHAGTGDVCRDDAASAATPFVTSPPVSPGRAGGAAPALAGLRLEKPVYGHPGAVFDPHPLGSAASAHATPGSLGVLEHNCNGTSGAERAWWDQLDWWWARRAYEKAKELERLAAVARADHFGVAGFACTHAEARFRAERRALWYDERARGLHVPRAHRVRECGHGDGVALRCACGRHVVTPACGQVQLCGRCRKRCFARVRRRTVRALHAHVRASQRAWEARGRPRGGRRTLTMATLTVRHSGSLETDRAVLVRAWCRLRAWIRKRIIQRFCPLRLDGSKGGVRCGCGRRCGRFLYVMVWEQTPGDDGRGHVHAHVVVLLPFIEWADIHAEWKRATDKRSTFIHLRTDGGKSPERAAHYLAKYASKGVDLAGPEQWAPELAARALAMQWGRRKVSASHGAWLPEPEGCTTCGERWAVLELPPRRALMAPAWMHRLNWSGADPPPPRRYGHTA